MSSDSPLPQDHSLLAPPPSTAQLRRLHITVNPSLSPQDQTLLERGQPPPSAITDVFRRRSTPLPFSRTDVFRSRLPAFPHFPRTDFIRSGSPSPSSSQLHRILTSRPSSICTSPTMGDSSHKWRPIPLPSPPPWFLSSPKLVPTQVLPYCLSVSIFSGHSSIHFSLAILSLRRWFCSDQLVTTFLLTAPSFHLRCHTLPSQHHKSRSSFPTGLSIFSISHHLHNFFSFIFMHYRIWTTSTSYRSFLLFLADLLPPFTDFSLDSYRQFLALKLRRGWILFW